MNLTQGLLRSLALWPQREAVVCGERRRSFAEFGERVARLGAGLCALGMRPGDRVAMLGLNSDRYLEYLLAVPWAGGVLNPVNTRWASAEIIFSLNDSGSTILILDDAFSSLAGAIKAGAPTLRHLVHAG